jgi:hypothetical protein
MSKLIVQRLNLNCESKIELSYYDSKDRFLKVKPICIHCGTPGSFLLGQNELRERNLTKGYNCFPICVVCLDSRNRKEVVRGEAKDLMAARAERTDTTN